MLYISTTLPVADYEAINKTALAAEFARLIGVKPILVTPMGATFSIEAPDHQVLFKFALQAGKEVAK